MSRKLARELLKKLPGWEASATRRAHIRLEHEASGQCVIAAGSPSDWRSIRNTLAMCRCVERAHEAEKKRPTSVGRR